MPKVTFILRDGTEKTFEFEQGKLPFQDTVCANRFSTWR